jgi:hypothetical protein
MPHAPHPSQAPTDPLARRSFSWREILAAVGPVALLIGGWAHGKLWGLDTRTTILETQRAADVRSGEQAETRRDRRDQEIQDALRRLEQKVDSLSSRP